jgi:hypothetical protein
MAFLTQAFDADSVEPSAPREILPAGKYAAQIVESDVKENSKGTGQILALTFEITEGPHARRKLWTNLNIINDNAQAQEIAQRDLSAICKAIGVRNVQDTEILHWKPLLVTVVVKLAGHKEKNGYVHDKDRNEVNGYAAIGGAYQGGQQAPPQPRPAPVRQQAPAPAAQGPVAASDGGGRPASMPWKRTA